MASPNLSEIVTTTLRNRSRQLADNVSNGNALLQRLNQRGNIRTFGGGRNIVQELEYAENSTFKYYSGYEQLDISPSDVITAAEFDIKQAAVNVSISGLEQLQNSSRERMIDLMQSRITNAERTMTNNLTTGIYSDGTGSNGKQVTGLQSLIADSPATGTVGGINRANFSFWRNQTFDFSDDTADSAASAGNIQQGMRTLWLDCSRGTDKPDLIVMDKNYFEFYWSSLTDIQRINRTDRGVSGFDSLAFVTADVVFEDSGIPSNHGYFLNTDFLFWRPHRDRNMVPLETRMSVNQDAEVVPLVFAGNLAMSNADVQGVLKN